MTTAAPDERAAGAIDFDTAPDRWRHWRLGVDGTVATLSLDVAEDAPLHGDAPLKMNSYDLGVDIELADAVQRLRFEHPEVRVVVLTSGRAGVFSAGANIPMLAAASHPFKVNFCKYTNETRNAIEDAAAHSGQTWMCALNGTASGGGYELAMACDHILLVDDGSSAVSLPEGPLLAVLPGTGGLTRLVDKRRVRRDLADAFCTTAEGARGERALAWGLVDELAPRSGFDAAVRARAQTLAAASDRPAAATGISLGALRPRLDGDAIVHPHVRVEVDRGRGVATLEVAGPTPADAAADLAAVHRLGDAWWPLAVAREIDDALLRLRFGEPEAGTLVLRSRGDPAAVAAVDATLLAHADDWLVREIVLMLARTLRRLDLTARSLIALIEPGSCFTGTLLELVLAADRSWMLDAGEATAAAPVVAVTGMNLGPLPATGGWSRLLAHFSGRDDAAAAVAARIGEPLVAAAAAELGLVTATPDELDWEDEVRLGLEERASFSADALTAMEASLRFPGPETLHSKVFGRLSAWQNWVFQRPNATGENGALPSFGTGRRPRFDRRRT